MSIQYFELSDPLNTCQFIYEHYYILQYLTENEAINNLINSDNKSWIFRYDKNKSKYFLSMKIDDNIINHHVYYYHNQKGYIIEYNFDFSKKKIYSDLDEYLVKMRGVYGIDLKKQIVIGQE